MNRTTVLRVVTKRLFNVQGKVSQALVLGVNDGEADDVALIIDGGVVLMGCLWVVYRC